MALKRSSSRRKARTPSLHYRSPDQNGHFAQVGSFLAKRRATGDISTTDIEVVVGHQKDYLHSVVGCAHSTLIRQLVESGGNRAPYSLNLDGFRERSVFKVIDWMYHGNVDLCTQNIGDHLAVTAHLGVATLHHWLEKRLVKMASKNSQKIFCVNVAADDHFKIATPTRDQILAAFVHEREKHTEKQLEQLSVAAVIALVSFEAANMREKVGALNLAVRWLRERMTYADNVLPEMKVPNMSLDDHLAFIDDLRDSLQNSGPRRLTTHVVLGENNRIGVSSDPASFQRSAANLDARNQSAYSQEPLDYRQIVSLPKNSRSSRSRSSSVASIRSEDFFRPTTRSSQRCINADVMSDEELQELQRLPEISNGRPSRSRSLCRSANSRSTSPADRTVGRKNYTVKEIEDIHCLPSITAYSDAKFIRGNRAYRADDVREMQRLPNYFEQTPGYYQSVLPPAYQSFYGPGCDTIAEYANCPDFSNSTHSRVFYPQRSEISVHNKRLLGERSLCDLQQIPSNWSQPMSSAHFDGRMDQHQFVLPVTPSYVQLQAQPPSNQCSSVGFGNFSAAIPPQNATSYIHAGVNSQRRRGSIPRERSLSSPSISECSVRSQYFDDCFNKCSGQNSAYVMMPEKKVTQKKQKKQRGKKNAVSHGAMQKWFDLYDVIYHPPGQYRPPRCA